MEFQVIDTFDDEIVSAGHKTREDAERAKLQYCQQWDAVHWNVKIERVQPAQSELIHTLFCYGTLQQPHTQRELIGRELSGPVCTMKGFKIVRNVFDPTDGNFYPSLVFDKESIVYGHAYKVTAEELAILDDYETELYTRVKSQVISAETGEQVPVEIYMAAPTPAAQ